MYPNGFQNEQQGSSRRLSWLAVYFLVVFMGAALLSPWLYHAVHRLSAPFDFLRGIADHPFHRYVNRALIFLGAVGLWPLLRLVGLNSWPSVGFGRSYDIAKRLTQGFLIGFGSLALTAGMVVIAGARVLNDRTIGEVAAYVILALASAIFVACLEELLFRGALFNAMRSSMALPAALVFSSAIYAILHFFQRPPEPESVKWFSGFIILAEMCRGFWEWKALVPGFFNLLLAGLILTAAFQWSGTLYFSIGLHAGWIFWLKSYGFMTDEVATASTWIWGSRKLIDGWLAFVVLLLVWFVVLQIKHGRSVESNNMPETQN